jgi:hypothetical protein
MPVFTGTTILSHAGGGGLGVFGFPSSPSAPSRGVQKRSYSLNLPPPVAEAVETFQTGASGAHPNMRNIFKSSSYSQVSRHMVFRQICRLETRKLSDFSCVEKKVKPAELLPVGSFMEPALSFMQQFPVI